MDFKYKNFKVSDVCLECVPCEHVVEFTLYDNTKKLIELPSFIIADLYKENNMVIPEHFLENDDCSFSLFD